MKKKISNFFKIILIVLLVVAVIIATGAITVSSLAVHCDLQEDQFYTCQSRDIVFGLTLSKVTATQVFRIDSETHCSSGSKRGCSTRAWFETASGEEITLSRVYTNNAQVSKVVNALSPLMENKSTPIDMVFPPAPLVLVIMSCATLFFIAILGFVALIFLFGKDPKDIEAGAIHLNLERKK